ncbi:MAG TPA: hypothetical protein VIY30_05195 [Burkholderiaceae bacterium]
MKITLSMLACSAILLPAQPSAAADDVSPAEKALFVTNHLATLKPPTTLRYSLRKSGTLEPGFEDKVSISLRAQPDGRCCSAAAEFLSGSRRLSLPEVESAEGNPVILYFLERDIREMQRLTKGQPNYFRKRIRMAVYQGATMNETSVGYLGRSVAARQITVAPYVDDPLRPRFETLAEKRYVFTLSDQVPGGVVSIRSQVEGTGASPLLVEEMTLEGATRQP